MEEFTVAFVRALWTVNYNLAFIAVVLIAIFLVLIFKNMGGKK